MVTPVFLQLDTPLQIGGPVAGIIYLTGILFTMNFQKKEKKPQFAFTLCATPLAFQLFVWGALMPHVDEMKNSTKRVALYLDENVHKGTTIVIGNKIGSPPSLPFYLKTRFSTVEESYRLEKQREHYKADKPSALILNKADKEWFERQNIDIKFHTISSLMTDRKEVANYYVAFNALARKQQ